MHVNVNSINSMATIIKFLPLDSEFLGVSQRNIPKKIKSAVYLLQISALI